MIRAYCGVPTECTEETVQKHFNSLLIKIGIKMVFMHSECCLSSTLEQSAEEIDRKEAASPTESNIPLQPNCFYSYMPLDGTPSPTRHPVVRLLEKKPKKGKQAIVFINCSLPQEKDYKDLPIDVHKDIVFKDEISNKEVGWYNLKTNIIWTSDIFHFIENSKRLIPQIVEAVSSFQRFGRVEEILTVGADPEFEIINEDGHFVEAHRLFGEMNQEIGYDGHSATGELRPKADKSPLGLTRNIKRLVRRLNNLNCMNGNKVWVGGGVNVTTGGHIHFGLKGLNQEVKDMLYDLVGFHVIAFQSERRMNNERSNWERGAGGNFRDQPHGSEWRPLPSFIVSEDITAAILSTSYAIIKSWKYHNYRRPQGAAKIEDYYKIPLYSAYKEQIDKFIKFFVKKEEKITLQKKDIFKEWNVESVKREFTVDILTSSEWLSSFFTPVNVKLQKPVKIEIRFSGEMITTFGFKGDQLTELCSFAENHFLPPVSITEKLPRGQTRPLICLPAAWFHMADTSKFCIAFKSVLKNLIIQLGGAA